jgi:2-phospho-L-lactate/phosphoenolpyruvate guanylyltransferase
LLFVKEQEDFSPMCIWAIVPVKPLRRGKSRLASVLTEDERALLNQTMLTNTIKTLTTTIDITQVLVVSRDPSALTLAREYSARTLLEDGNPGLNTALKRATKIAQAYSACGVLILPADLPLVTPEIIQNFLRRSVKSTEMVIAPDRWMQGTNALLVKPVGAIEYCFGPGSFNRHLLQARQLKIDTEVYEDFALGLDLDLPEDLEKLRQIGALPIHVSSLEAK